MDQENLNETTNTQMDQEKPIKITNTKQFDCLVQLMEQNKDIAKGYFSFGSSKQDYNTAWNKFAEKSNSIGPPVREGPGWQKVWTDFKGKIKKKLSNNKKEITATGGGPCRIQTLSPLEESVSRLLYYEKLFEKSTTSFGLTKQSSSVVTNVSTAVSNFPSTSSSTIVNCNIDTLPEVVHLNDSQHHTEEVAAIPKQTVNRKKNTTNSERQCLLHTQTKYMEQIDKSTKECARYARKSYEVKEKKFKMWAKFHLDKQKYLKDNFELKLRNIKYKERKLAFEESKYAN